MRRPLLLAALLTAAAALLFSSKGVLVKICFAHGASALPVLALRMGFSLPIFIALAWREDRLAGAALAWPLRLRVAACGIVGYYGASLLDFEGLRFISVGLERIVLFAYPCVVIALSAVLLRQRIAVRTLAAMAVAYAGIALSCLGEIAVGPRAATGIALVAGSAVCYAVFIVASSHLMRELGSMRFMANAMCGACVAVLVHAAACCAAADFRLDGTVYALGVALALLGTVAPALLSAEGLRRGGPQAFAVISAIGPASTVALAWALLGEVPRAAQGVGMALTTAACVAMALGGKAPAGGRPSAAVPDPLQPTDADRRCAVAASSPAASGTSR